MKCVTGKRMFDSKALAEEALIQNHIVNHHGQGQGPVNVYECRDCGRWHFTSKGEVSNVLHDPEIKQRIQKERTANDWERRLRR